MTLESDTTGVGGAGGFATDPPDPIRTTNTPEPPPVTPETPPVVPSAPSKRKRRTRAASQAEAMATLPPGGKCVDPDCPEHGENRAPKKCVETGKDIWPRMSDKEAVGFAITALTSINRAISMVSHVPLEPPTLQDGKDVAPPLSNVIHRRFGSLARFSAEFALLMVVSTYIMEKTSEARRKLKALEKGEAPNGTQTA